ncbi:MAG: pilus assembly PilX N-terminal domain-containing protein [Desulfobacterales bacterium]|nr:pilus assembly PilX N-terminal domain-containing protein [Desulfobacterales bacterium]
MQVTLNKNGSVTVIALVVLVAITALGTTLINLGTMEQNMAANEKFQDADFVEADACVYATAKFLRLTMDLQTDKSAVRQGIPEGDPLAPGIVYPPSSSLADFYDRIIMGENQSFYEQDPDDGVIKVMFAEDLSYNPNMLPALADIRPLDEAPTRGSGANQFAAGYSAGIGLGGAGGGAFSNWFILICEGRSLNDPDQGSRRVYARYRRVSIAGGL